MAALKTLSQAFSLARNAHTEHKATQKRTQKAQHLRLGFKKRRGREGGGGERVAKELFYPDRERRKKVEQEPPRNAEGREKGSKKVG